MVSFVMARLVSLRRKTHLPPEEDDGLEAHHVRVGREEVVLEVLGDFLRRAEGLVQRRQQVRVERVRRHERDVDRVRRVEARGPVGEDRDVPAVIERLVEVRGVEEPVVASCEPLRDGQLGDVEVLEPLRWCSPGSLARPT